MAIVDYKENSKPIYLQIVDRICDNIISGIYDTDGRIPSVRVSASEFQVNANTMMRAYEYMSQRGIICNQRGIGFYVTPDAIMQIRKLQEETFFNNEIDYFFERLNNMDVSPERLGKLYRDFIRDQKTKSDD